MPNIPPQTFDQPRSEENQKAALDKERAAEILPQNESLYSKLVSSLGGIVWEADGETFQFTFVSPQAERILGYPVEQWTSEPNFWRNHTHPDDADWCAAYCLDATAQRRDHEFKYRMIAADGRVVWLQDIVSVKIEADESVRLRGIMIDITERKRAEGALRKSESELRLAADAAGLGTWFWDEATNELIFDRRANALFGLPAEKKLTIEEFFTLLHADDRDEVLRVWREAVESGTEYQMDYRTRWPDGRTHWIAARGRSHHDETGNTPQMVGIVFDITKRKQREEQLRRTSERLELATRAASIGIWDWDVVKDELIWDDAMYRLFGVRKEDFSGAYDAWAKSLAPEDFEWAHAEVQAALRGEREWAGEFRIVWPDGSVHFIKAASQTFRDEAGRPLRMVGVNYDITERKRAEESLRASEERFSKAFNSSPIRMGIIRLEDGMILDVNDRWLRETGYAREEIIGHPALELKMWLGEEKQSRLRRLLKEAKPLRDVEYSLVTKTGEQRLTLISAEVIDLGGEPCYLWATNDITERRRTEEENRKLLRDLAERVKELTALHNTARILQHERTNVPVILREIAELLPPAFQYPAITAGRVRLGEIEYVMPGFTDALPILQAAFTTTDGQPGSIEVVYTEERPVADEGPYLAEERALINTLADMLRTDYDRRRAEDALRRSEDHLRLVTDTIPALVFSALPDGSVDFINQRHREFTGLSLDDVRGWRWTDVIHPEDRTELVDRWRATLVTGEPIEIEARLRRAAGDYRWLLIRALPLRDETGKMVKWYGTKTDIEDRKQAEEELRLSRERFFRTFHASPVAVILARLEDGQLIEVNEAAQRFFGFSREEMIGRTTVELGIWVKPDDRRHRVEELERLGSVREREYQFRTKQGEALIGLYSSELMEIDGVKCIQTVVQDITERKHAEEELMASHARLRALSESLRKAKEDEGIRIAREIHDELGSALTSLKWSLLRLDKVYSGDVKPDGQSGAQEEINEMVGLVDTTINTVRRIASELRPGVLDDLGLIPAIEWHAQQFQEHTGIVCRFDSLIENVELNRDQATTVFRIFQEAMTNILRHAQAKKVNIIIEEEEGEFVLEIKDNGKGITESERLGVGSLGLLGMRERAHSIGGRVEIKGSAGKGTVLIVHLPIKRDTTV